MVVDDEEQPGPRRALPSRPGHPRAHQDISDPPLVRPGGLVAAVCLRLGGQGLAVQPGAAQLPADGPLRDGDPVAVEQDRGDLRGRAARQLQPQRRGLGEQLRVGAHRPGVGPRRGPQRVQPALAPRSQPPVDRAPRVAAGRPVGMRVGARGDPPDQRPPLRRCQPLHGRLGDHRPPVQRHLLLLLVIHAVLLSRRSWRDRRHETPFADHQVGEVVLAAISPRRSPSTRTATPPAPAIPAGPPPRRTPRRSRLARTCRRPPPA
jgi:hypothetical protein